MESLSNGGDQDFWLCNIEPVDGVDTDTKCSDSFSIEQ